MVDLTLAIVCHLYGGPGSAGNPFLDNPSWLLNLLLLKLTNALFKGFAFLLLMASLSRRPTFCINPSLTLVVSRCVGRKTRSVVSWHTSILANFPPVIK